MPFLLSNYKLILIFTAIIACFLGGWYSHTVYDGYRADKIENKEVASLGKGENAIINWNQFYDKTIKDTKDNCLNKKIPMQILSGIK
jgi:hypothetical protein